MSERTGWIILFAVAPLIVISFLGLAALIVIPVVLALLAIGSKI
jgi:hypothetical protein